MLVDGIEPVEFKVGQVLKYFQSFAWALKDFCIQQNFKGKRTKFKRRRVVCIYYIDRRLFKEHVLLWRFGQCFQITTLHSIYTCEDLVKNPKLTIGQIVRKNKVTDDPKTTVGSLIDDLKTMYEVEVDLQEVYRAKKRYLSQLLLEIMLKSLDNFEILLTSLKKHMLKALTLLKVTKKNLQINANSKGSW